MTSGQCREREYWRSVAKNDVDNVTSTAVKLTAGCKETRKCT